MFKKILIANRGDQLRSSAAAQPHCVLSAAQVSDFNTESANV
ncbi:MAG: hypothetical protein ACRC01_07860 [Deefgea sp.]